MAMQQRVDEYVQVMSPTAAPQGPLVTPSIPKSVRENVVRRAISIPKNARIGHTRTTPRHADAIYSQLSQELKLPRVVKKNQRFQNKQAKARLKTEHQHQQSQSPPPPALAFSLDLDASGRYIAHFVQGGEPGRRLTPTRLGNSFRSTQTQRNLPQHKRSERSSSAMMRQELVEAIRREPRKTVAGAGGGGGGTPESPAPRRGDSNLNLVASPPGSSLNNTSKKPVGGQHVSMNEADLRRGGLFKESREKLGSSAQNLNNLRKVIGKRNPYLESLLKKMQTGQASGISLKNGERRAQQQQQQGSLSPSRAKSKPSYEAGSPRATGKENEQLRSVIERLAAENQALSGEVERLQAHSRRLEEEKRRMKAQVATSEKRKFILATELEEMSEVFSQSCFELSETQRAKEVVYTELVKAVGAKDTMQVNSDLERSRWEMKSKLVSAPTNLTQLEETLTKRNKEYDTSEESNKQLLYLLERYDAKVSDLRQEIDLKELKLQQAIGLKSRKYEQMHPGDAPLDLESLEDRIKFLVELLEKYKAQLETLSEPHSNYSLQSLQNALKKHSVCSSPAGGPKYKRQFSSDLRAGQGKEEEDEEGEGEAGELEQDEQGLLSEDEPPSIQE